MKPVAGPMIDRFEMLTLVRPDTHRGRTSRRDSYESTREPVG